MKCEELPLRATIFQEYGRAMWYLLLLFSLANGLGLAQIYGGSTPPPVDPLQGAYEALRQKRYEEAVRLFHETLRAMPERTEVRKDLAYTYLKIGENELAREQFGAVMRARTSDFRAALEYAFLCHETGERAKARRVFDRVRKTGDPESRATAEQAFQNIDRALGEGIARWSKVAEANPADFMAHLELARLAEERDELDLAATHYEAAWRLKPAERDLLVRLAAVWKALNRTDMATAALLAASRGPSPRAAESARELLPARYPYVYEFRMALEFDEGNLELRRELAYLLLAMDKPADAEKEFQAILERAPDDLLSSAQLGLMYLARNDKTRAGPLLEKVLAGPDEVLANRVRAALKLPLERKQPDTAAADAVTSDAKLLAERSLQKGYLADALRYLRAAHEADSTDPWVLLKLGWTYNVLHQDREALHWFDLARRSSDPRISWEARKAYESLRPEYARFRVTVWTFPLYSSRWRDAFSYSQAKVEMRLGRLPLRPYLSLRVMGDVRQTTGGPIPQYLSENAAIVGLGAVTRTWRGLTAWAEAGWARSLRRPQPGAGKIVPDYRGGLSFARGIGHSIGSTGWFYELNSDAVFISRFDNDVLIYLQNRGGWSLGSAKLLGGLETQLYLAANLVADARRAAWANFGELGPGIRFRWPFLRKGTVLFVEALRGAYTVDQGGIRAPQYYDLRGGVWYAFTR
jgi:Tfp pilus assembly protein PilF